MGERGCGVSDTETLVFADQIEPGHTIRFMKYTEGLVRTPVDGQVTQVRVWETCPLGLFGSDRKSEKRIIVIVCSEDGSMYDREFAAHHVVAILGRGEVDA